MKTNGNARRYRQSCQELKSFLLKQIPEMEWMKSDHQDELLTVVNHILIERGARSELWDIVIVIAEMMVENDIDEIKFISFVQHASAICGRSINA